ncbi:MAG TPA: bifunctional DNA-binding transcriptional regulator/O6-methylguanine-DNA methyltransferase Ada [Steroidobacteraceae bacterium]|jgi:AraC family transcriptional regulator of adaptative response/methylated-DNA-[protein]-cysteine methyltransferase|nr:bifunctional DNA-binding transcriptional regulator/O6-methylguanine-DNA methyltransferase Ada [Steroidobacteraceae bacterium]
MISVQPSSLPEREATARDPRWAAVMARDAQADDTFFYAVRTTGVYCRPSCPSRRAHPENVTFYGTLEEAEQAGFRACKRCRPRDASLSERRASTVAQSCAYIEQAEHLPSLRELARRAGLSAYHFHRVFKATTGLSPKAYATAHRARRVRGELKRAATVTQAIMDAGYNSGGRFYADSNALLGMTPRQYRTGGADTTIHFAIGDCSLGAILVARSRKGLCAILLGDDPAALLRELQDRFPLAHLVGGDARFERQVAAVIRFVDAPQLGLKLPLDVRGTAFQQRVWQALRQVPLGATVSYADLARRIGAPRAVRAVAQACASNHLAVAIPCHRVVRSDGALSGYRWGVARKRALLDREGALDAAG